MGGLRSILVGILGLVSSLALAVEDRAPAVAVHLLEGRGVDLDEKDLVELTDYAGVRFGEAAACQIIPWAQVQEKIRTKGYYMCMDRHCQVEAERMLGADYTLVLSVLPMGKACIVTGSLYPKESPATLRTAMHKGVCGREDLAASLDKVIETLARQGPLLTNEAPDARPEPERVSDLDDENVSSPGAGPTEREEFEGDEEEEGRDGPRGRRPLMVWRQPMYLGLFAVYAPAPILLWDDGYGSGAEKMLDQYGPRFTLDVEVGEVWLMGLQVDGLGNRDFWIMEVIGRGGGQIIFGDSLQIYGLLGIGISAWFDGPWSGNYEGVVLSGTLGARYLFNRTFGLQVELSGTASFFSENDGMFSELDLDLFRLEMAAGLVLVF